MYKKEKMPSRSKPTICIITLFRSLNFGAFLQAYALKRILEERNVYPVFMDVYGFRQSFKRLLVLFKPKDITVSGLVFAYKKWKTFSVSQRQNLSIESYDKACAGFFSGSDEIWNVSNSSFVSVPAFFGNRLSSTSKVFSYAPSCGNSDIEKLLVDKDVLEGMAKFDKISVRDENTYQFAVRARPDVEVVKVLDPTFLYDFSLDEEAVELPDRYCVVYSYKMSAERTNEIRRYAKRNGLILVSPGFHNSWCDQVTPCSPFQFLTLVKNAHSIITDTYHGAIFAIKYKKNFIAYYEGKEKVRDLLKDLGLEASGYTLGMLDKHEDIETDYSVFNFLVRSKVDSSKRFLDDCISMIDKYRA
ncbi:MAG: polysaccharide pyruvyl transferase family protein [Pseudomonadota bacterium]|nr:polysaccharide pyruvyl transferase family protein [Pseudomonadota bacterium]